LKLRVLEALFGFQALTMEVSGEVGRLEGWGRYEVPKKRLRSGVGPKKT
jgi:hypothetical protein